MVMSFFYLLQVTISCDLAVLTPLDAVPEALIAPSRYAERDTGERKRGK